jgi:arylsulfatase A-like enzyme
MKRFLSLLLLMLLISCSRYKDFYNFREILKKENIKDSPYYEIYKNLENRREILKNWIFFKEFSKGKKVKVWKAETSSPILNLYENGSLDRLKLSVEGVKANFYPEKGFLENPSEYSWTINENGEGRNNVFLALPSKTFPKNVEISYLTLNGNFLSNGSIIKAKNLLKEERNDFIEDFSGENLFGLKRKIHFYDQTWDAIFAPPRTELEFPVKIYKDSILEFGYFLISWEKKSNVFVSIYFCKKNSCKRLFSKEISPKEEPDIILEKIEVGKNIEGEGRLIFLTDCKSRESAFFAWINPHLYRKKESERTKNVILISLDALRRDYVGIYRGEKDFTPNIDRLAEDSVVFENAYSQAPWTIPSHLSILSGLNPNSHGANTFSDKVPSFVKTLPQILREKGYLTFAYTGGGLVSSNFGFSNGFNQYKEWDGSELPDSSRPVFERFNNFISSNKGKNFFLFLHTYQFHDPLESPEEILEKVSKGKKPIWKGVSISQLIGGGKGTYKPLKEEEIESIKILAKAESRTIDEHLIGPLINKLKEEGIYDQTMIIITSDHGDEYFDHGGWQHAHTLYNELIRVPLIIKFPYQKFKGKRINKNVRLIDIAPTILDVLGFNPEKYNMDGKSLIPVIEDKEREERKCFSEIYYDPTRPHIPQRVSLVYGDYKLIVNQLISEWEKFFSYPPTPLQPFELYDLRNDPFEKNNLYSERRETALLLLEMIKEYKRKTPPNVEKGIINEELRAKLKALGYIDF